MFVRDTISMNAINEMSYINDLYESLTCEIFTSSKRYIISCIYRPPHTSISRFNEHLQENILSKLSLTHNSIVCDDLNINLFNPTILASINDFISLLLSFNFYPIINLPTKYNPTNPITKFSLIDQIWINFYPLILESFVITNEISDHYSTCMCFQSNHKLTSIVKKISHI